MRRFDYVRDKKLLENIPFLYEMTLPSIIHAGYVLNKNGVDEIVMQDVLYYNDFPYVFLPRNKKIWGNSAMLWIDSEDIKKLEREVEILIKKPIGHSYNYLTKDFIELHGKKNANMHRHINQFKNNYSFKITHKYDTEKVFDFITKWDKKQKIRTPSYAHSLEYFIFCLKNLEKFDIKSIFVEVDGTLAGLAMGVAFDESRWVGLHLKTDYSYKGLSRFLHHERAKMFSEYEEFTLGSGGCGDDGIINYKDSLHPAKKTEYFYILTEKRTHPANMQGAK